MVLILFQGTETICLPRSSIAVNGTKMIKMLLSSLGCMGYQGRIQDFVLGDEFRRGVWGQLEVPSGPGQSPDGGVGGWRQPEADGFDQYC